MARYKYKAISSDGKPVKGFYEANSKDDVLVMLKQNQCYPIDIKEEIKTSREIDLKKLLRKASIKDIAVFCRQFQVMLQAGVSLISCLDILRQQTEKKLMKETIEKVYEGVQQGYTLSEAMKRNNAVFPELLINMVVAGEASGNLDVILDRMASQYEREHKIINKVRGAMVYPAVLTIVAVFIVVFMLTFILPRFTGVFQSTGATLPLPTRVFLSISSFITGYWYIVIVGVVLIVFSFMNLLKNDKVKYTLDSYKFKVPILKGINQKVITSRFARTLSTLLASGMPLLQALDIIGKVLDNKVLEYGIENAKEEVRRGALLSVPIKKMNLFPPMLVNMLAIGEESGSIDELLNKTANFYDDEAEAALEAMTRLIEPLMLIVVSLIIGSIVASIIMPLADMMNNIAM